MKVVLAILAFIAIFAMFCATENKERILYAISFVAVIIGMIALAVLDWVALCLY